MKKSVYIGIGASAGGLHAFQNIVHQLPKSKNYVYIIAQHLDASKKSTLSAILAKQTTLEIIEISHETQFLPNHIYIIPPGFNIIFFHHHLKLQKIDTLPHKASPSIDKLFESLAMYKKSDAVAILLSGTGDDGSYGMKKIKEYGGITIVQSPKEAEYSSMPLSAINTDKIDYILELNQITKFLAAIIEKDKNSLPLTIEELNTPLQSIQLLLVEKKNLDIKKYKNETIMRRIHKRMGLVHVKGIDDYLRYIQNNPDELHLLYENILIGVTSFFRDKKAFETLRSELFFYLQAKPNNYKLRLWSIACSSGEEAYSLSILVTEISKELNKTFKTRIFATDIDEPSLNRARAGIYNEESMKNIDKILLDKYFTKIESGYKVIEAIRKNIVFTNHNILSDPPFIKQDLISCRNFLIYIIPEIQQETFKLLNYSLKDDGVLFLGSSESTLTSSKYFKTINSEHKIYKKEKQEQPPKISHNYFAKHLKEKNYEEIKSKTNSQNIEKLIADKMFNFFAPNFILIDKNNIIIYKRGTLPFMQMQDGFVTLNILENIEKKLRYDLKVIINRTFTLQQRQESKFIETTLHEENEFVKIIAYPFEMQNASPMLLLYFLQLDTKDLQFNTNSLIGENNSFMLGNLTKQLEQVEEDNYLLSDQLIINKENMQLLNEELQSSNEELQSSNEELETSNEELQSSNEELHISIHNEQIMQKKLSEILNSSQDGIIGLDVDGNHTFVNEAALTILGYTRDELIGNNTHRAWHHTKADGAPYQLQECKLHHGLSHGVSIRKKDLFWRKDGTAIEVAVAQNPIKDGNKIIGAVLSFHDITQENLLKKELEYEHNLAENYLNISGTLVMTLDIYGNITMINNQGCKLLALNKGGAIGKNFIDNFVPLEIRPQVKEVFHSIIIGDKDIVTHYKNPLLDANKEIHYMSWVNNFTRDKSGKITGLITSGTDITEEEKLSKKLQKQEQLYKLTFEEADIGIAHVSLKGDLIDTNEYLSTLLGYTKEELQSMSVNAITHPKDIDKDKQMRNKLISKKSFNYHVEKRYIDKRGSTIWVNLSVVLLKDDLARPLYFLKIIRDITQLKLLMYELEQEKNRFKKIIEFIPIPVIIYDEDGKMLFINKIFKEIFGYNTAELSTIPIFINKLFPHEEMLKKEQLFAYYNNPLTQEVHEQDLTTKMDKNRSVILNAVALNKQQDSDKTIYIIAMIDITEIQEKDELMIAQSRQAAMGEMLSMIAHQWRQPLSVISMVGNNLQADIELEEKITMERLKELIKTLNTQTSYLSQTVEDFKNFFKPEKKRELVNIQNIFDKITTLIKKSLIHNDIRFELPNNEDILIKTYPNQLVQVLMNIINNAKDALVMKTLQDAFIIINVQQIDNECIISICDNGGGIEPSIKNKLGEAYVSTKSKNGTGLGLYMSMIIINKHLDGRLYWESDEKGSCFYIALPFKSQS